jgi:hypothetical protein
MLMLLPLLLLPPLLLLLLLLQVYFSKDFVHLLVQLSDGHLRARVLQQLHNLARGRWPARMFSSNAVSQRYQGIINVHQVEGLSLVWMVDADRSTCTQVGQQRRTSASRTRSLSISCASLSKHTKNCCGDTAL